MAKPRLFISHSAKDALPKSFLNDLLGKLDGDGRFDVYVDKERLELGTYWRSTLNLWIGGCDAAIVLLSKAALESSYVAYETSILCYRKEANPDFQVIPVWVGAMCEKDIEKSILNPSRISEIQPVRVSDAAAFGDALDEIVGKLQHVARCATPAERHAKFLARTLEHLSEGDLKDAIQDLGFDLGSWRPQEELAQSLAFQLLGCGLENATPIIMSLRDRFDNKRREKVELLIELIACSWADFKAAQTLTQAASCKGERSVALNACDETTARMYVNVAGLHLAPSRLPTNTWKVLSVSGVFGEVRDPAEPPPRLVSAIEKALRGAFCGSMKDLKQALEIQLKHEPVLVALPATPGFSVKWLDALHKIFPGVTFFLLLGEEEIRPESIDKDRIVLLEPLLEKGSEKAFCSTYKENKHYLMGDLPND